MGCCSIFIGRVAFAGLGLPKFVLAGMNGAGLKAETARQMLRSQSAVDAECRTCLGKAPEKVSDTISWGLGIGLATTPSGRSFWHWGDNGDFKAFVTGSEVSRRGVVIFTNSANGMMIIPDRPRGNGRHACR